MVITRSGAPARNLVRRVGARPRGGATAARGIFGRGGGWEMTRVPLVVGMGIRNIRRKLGNSNGVKERLSCEVSLKRNLGCRFWKEVIKQKLCFAWLVTGVAGDSHL